MLFPFALLLSPDPPRFTREFVWKSKGIEHRALVAVEGAQGPRYVCRLKYQGAPGKKWESRIADDDGPIQKKPLIQAEKIVGGGRLIMISTQVPNWHRTTFWVAGDKKAEPLVLKYRDVADHVFMYWKSAKNEVTSLTIFDRWVGGNSTTVIRNGKRLDRWEEITTYSLDRNGLRKVEQHRRLIPNSGGGKSERTYRRLGVHR